MAQAVTVAGASYTDVPGVNLPKTGGGTAYFADPSPVTAVESDVAQGKIFVKADGSLGTGTASGGGTDVFTVTLTQNASTGYWEPNKTFAEISSAYSAGDTIIVSATNEYDEVLPTSCTFFDNEFPSFEYHIDWFDYDTDHYFSDVYGYSANGLEQYEHSEYGYPTTLVEKTITANGTYNPILTDYADGYSLVTVNVPTGSTKALYKYEGLASRTANSYGSTNATVTVTKAGTYNISYVAVRGSSSGTMGTNLHIGSTTGTNNTTWNNGTYGQYVTLTNQQIAANTAVTIYATSGNNSRTIYVGQLIVEEV